MFGWLGVTKLLAYFLIYYFCMRAFTISRTHENKSSHLIRPRVISLHHLLLNRLISISSLKRFSNESSILVCRYRSSSYAMTTLIFISYDDLLTTVMYRNHQTYQKTEQHTKLESSVFTLKLKLCQFKRG